MNRCLLLVPLLLASGGCSLAAATAGADRDTVRSLAELDGAFITGLASGIAASFQDRERRRPPLPADAHMCWLDLQGGVEIYAVHEAHAEALCRSRWGDSAVCRCEWIGGRDR